jgi:hypothetical protein
MRSPASWLSSLSIAPPRRFDPEYLDAPSVDDALLVRSVSDIVRSNRLFGGRRAVLRSLGTIFPTLPPQATLLDVGTGLGDLPREACRVAAARGIALHAIGLDGKFALARAAGAQSNTAAHRPPHPAVYSAARPTLRLTPSDSANMATVLPVCGSAFQLPFADRSVDITMCSQLLHHFRGDDARQVVRELNRVARRAVLISDLRRSWLAAAGFWAASFPLGFHPVTRHDGTVSVMRGFTGAELRETVADAIGVSPTIQYWLGFRVSAHWVPV